MTTEQTNFINNIATLVKKYASQYGISVHSPIIAQAINESNWGKSSLSAQYHNYFGLKCGSSWTGKSVNLSTKEEYTAGTLTDIKANFRVYDSMEEGVKGYFDFINTSRYANLKGVTDPRQYLENIKADGYATSSGYVTNVYNLVTTYNLTQFDSVQETVQAASTPAPASSSTFSTGDKVNVLNAVTYDGQSFKTYYSTYDVIQANGDRIVIGINGTVTAAVNAANLQKVSGAATPAQASIGVGSRIKIRSGANQYGKGTGFASFVYSTVYTVIQISGDRVVFGLNGVVTGAVSKNDCILQ